MKKKNKDKTQNYNKPFSERKFTELKDGLILNRQNKIGDAKSNLAI